MLREVFEATAMAAAEKTHKRIAKGRAAIKPRRAPLERRVSGGGQNERVQMRTLAGLPDMQAGYV